MRLYKNIGYISYPQLGVTTHTDPMELQSVNIPDRYRITQRQVPDTLPAGATLVNVNKDKTAALSERRRKLSSFVDTSSQWKLNTISGHEAQHAIFGKIKQKYGQAQAKELIEKTLSVLTPVEKKILGYININKDQYNPEFQDEELIAHFHNYLQDKNYRKKVHDGLGLSDSGSRTLHNLVKKTWIKMRNHAKTITIEDLKKREPPKFPKLGIPDQKNRTELIDNISRFSNKIRVMAHEGAKSFYPREVAVWDPETQSVKQAPVSQSTIRYYQTGAKHEVKAVVEAVTAGDVNTVGGARGSHAYALSGLLRPGSWLANNDPLGTAKHEDFHLQLNRVEQKYGRRARLALAENLYHALSPHHQAAIDYVQSHFAGDIYEKKNPATVNEEKLARLFNILNSSNTRRTFHYAQQQKTHELPNGDTLPKEYSRQKYYIPGLDFTPNQQQFDGILKDAHRTLVAAAEVANEDWLKWGHVRDKTLKAIGVLKSEKDIINSEVISHMLGYSHAMQVLHQAAKFLTNKTVDNKEVKARLKAVGDPKKAILLAYGLEINEKNIQALSSISKMIGLKKSEDNLSFLKEESHEFKAILPDSEDLVKILQESAKMQRVHKIELQGKHAENSYLVLGSEEKSWIIKVESSKKSPALGMEQDLATQSEREAAFYHISKVLGLQDFIPRTELVLMNGQQAACIELLPFSWKSLDFLQYTDPTAAVDTLNKYRISGDLFKWSALDYMLGNVDSHGQNIMVSPKEEGYIAKLIDHGSAFAGDDFNPAYDPETWVPYYLRIWTAFRWNELTQKEKLDAMPKANTTTVQMLKHWISSIDPTDIGRICQKYGIKAGPSLDRLQKLKELDDPAAGLNKLWVY